MIPFPVKRSSPARRLSLPLLLSAVPTLGLWIGARSAHAETPQVLSWIRADVDGDGTQDTLTLRGDGTLLVEWQGAPVSTLRLGDNLLLKRPAAVTFDATSGGRVILARATEVRRGGATQARALAVVATGRKLTVAYSGDVGPVGRDGEYSQDLAVTSAGLVRFQSAPNIRRCDGEVRLFAERYREGTGFQPYPELTLPGAPNSTAPASAAPLVSSTPPAEFASPPLGVYRWVAASSQAHVTRADGLGPPRELEDDSPLSSWAPPQPRGAFVTAQADGAGHALRALRISAARGRPLPSRLSLIVSGTVRFDVDLASAPVQWVTFPADAAPSADCLSLVIRDGAPDAAIGDVAIYSELDGQGGLTTVAGLVASGTGSRGEGAARTLLLRARRDATGRQAVLDAIAQALRQPASAQPEGLARLEDLLLQLADADAAAATPAGLAPAQSAASAQLDDLLWSVVQRRLRDAGGSDAAMAKASDTLGFLRALSTYKKVGPRLLLRIWDDPKLPSEGRASAVALWAAMAPKDVPGRLLPQLSTVAGDTKLGGGWAAALAAALRCRPTDDPGMAALLDPLSTRLSTAGAGGDALAAAVLLLQAAAQSQASCPDAAQRGKVADRIAQGWPAGAASATTRPNGTAPDRFVLQYRILQALDRLAVATPTVHALLGQVLTTEAEPVLRQLAGGLRVRLAGGLATDDRLLGLRDADAGVRLATASALLATADGGPAGLAPTAISPISSTDLGHLDQAALRDAWPKVRRAAIEARAAQCKDAGAAAGPRVDSLRQALSDRDLDVQRRALAGLARCEGIGALDELVRVANQADAKAGLRGQACGLLAKHAMSAPSLSASQRQQAHQAAGGALLDLLRDPQADDRHAAALSQCLRGFQESGDVTDVPTLIEATAADSPATVRQLAFAAIGGICARRSASSSGASVGPGANSALPSKVKKALAESVAAVFTGRQDLRLQASARRAQQLCP